MSRECTECTSFKGFDEDGLPICEYDSGESCPYNDEERAEKRECDSGFQIIINGETISEYIRDTIRNTINRNTREIVQSSIREIVTETCKEEITEITKASIQTVVDEQVSKFMTGDITVGGGWREESRTISRKDYMTELIQKELDKRFDASGVRGEAEKLATDAINTFLRKSRDQINARCKTYFDEATRSILTENVVSMLMDNETYKRLSDSMKNLLGEGK